MRERAKRLVQGGIQRVSGDRVVWRGPSSRRRVALTFDDGPHPLTAEFLAVLAELAAPATFFVMGTYLEEQPGIAADYLRDGHQLAGHGFYHRRFTELTAVELREQLAATAQAIGHRAEGLWVRPPHGAIGPRQLATLFAARYRVAMWSHDSHDHHETSPAAIAARCHPSQIAPGEVLLFHEGAAATLAALPVIVGELRAAGYELVTMAELFR